MAEPFVKSVVLTRGDVPDFDSYYELTRSFLEDRDRFLHHLFAD